MMRKVNQRTHDGRQKVETDLLLGTTFITILFHIISLDELSIVFLGASLVTLGTHHRDHLFAVWQLYPTYIVLLLEITHLLLFYGAQVEFPILTHFRYYTSLFAIAISYGLLTVLPIPKIPQATGPYSVGTITDHWLVDTSQTNENDSEKFLYEQNDTKHNMWLKIYYPAEASGRFAKRAPYVSIPNLHGDTEHYIGIWLGKISDLLSFVSWHVESCTDCNSTYAPPMLSVTEVPKFPVIIYSHGQGSCPEKQTAVCEDLASNGFVVCAMYHRDWDKRYPGPMKRRLQETTFTLERLSAINVDLNLQVGVQVPAVRLQDGSYKRLQNQGVFYQRLDFSKGVGLFGHSFGGTTAILVAEENYPKQKSRLPRISCSLAMDPWMWPLPQNTPTLNKPLMFLKSDLWCSKQDDLEKIQSYCKNTTSDAIVVTMHGTAHQNFTDIPFLITSTLGVVLLPSYFLQESNGTMKIIGPSEPKRTHATIKALVLDYFKHHFGSSSDSTFDLRNTSTYTVQKYQA